MAQLGLWGGHRFSRSPGASWGPGSGLGVERELLDSSPLCLFSHPPRNRNSVSRAGCGFRSGWISKSNLCSVLVPTPSLGRRFWIPSPVQAAGPVRPARDSQSGECLFLRQERHVQRAGELGTVPLQMPASWGMWVMGSRLAPSSNFEEGRLCPEIHRALLLLGGRPLSTICGHGALVEWMEL